MTKFLQTLIDGLSVGSFYALIALGYTMVYGILKFINFAHGDIFMVGAWFGFFLCLRLGWAGLGAAPPAYAFAVVLGSSMLVCGTLGYLIQRLAYKPLRGAPRLNVLITAIGVSLLLQNIGQLPVVFGKESQRMPPLVADRTLATVANVHLRLVDAIGFLTTLALLSLLLWLIYRTRIGLAMRAVSQDARTASLMGVNVDRTIAVTFVIGSVLAAAAGFLYTMKYPGLNQPAHATWLLLGLKAFVAAVVGGIGDLQGAVLGGFLIGLIELFGAAYLSPHLRDVYVFSILIIVLLVRPAGLLGRVEAEKV